MTLACWSTSTGQGSGVAGGGRSLLVEQAGPDGIGPGPVPFLGLGGESERHDGAAVIIRVAVGNHLDLPSRNEGAWAEPTGSGDPRALFYWLLTLTI